MDKTTVDVPPAGVVLKNHLGIRLPVLTFNTKAALRRLLKWMSLSLKSSKCSYSPRQILSAVGSLHPRFLISPTKSSIVMPTLSAYTCTVLFIVVIP
ncbi:MAG: hypothetical protein KJZ77_19135 [Anaerolineales bacterium]|nr:hypothetical protein [Anaerolineales bacterium]